MQKAIKLEKNSTKLSEVIVQGMLEKKGQDIVVIDLRNIKNSVADYFVVCSGSSDTQLDAIADSIEEEVHKSIKQKPWKREGKEYKEWILIDYVDVVAHVFLNEKRKFYGLEDLWGDALIQRVEAGN